jgi:amino acid adenylation domain-containing protein
MTTAAFLTELRRREIKIVVEGDRLRCVAPKGALTPEIQREIGARKADLLAFLAARPAAPTLTAASRGGVLPLSFGQERLWFLSQLEGDTTAHNIFAAIRFRRWLDVPALERSLTEILRRQEVLRTVFPMVDGAPSLRINPPAPVTLPPIDLRTLTPLERDDAIDRLKRDGVAATFDLQRGPLITFTLLRLEDADWELLVAQHHIVTDRWSLGLLLNEIQRHYDAFAGGGAPPLPELAIQYVDFAAWQRHTAAVRDDQLQYWRERLRGPLPVLDLPADRPRPPLQTYRGAWEGRLIPESLTGALRALSQQEGVTLYMTLLAAFKALLARHTGLTDILVGSPVAGRQREELEPIIGYFINTVVLRTDCSGDPTFRQLLTRVRDTTLDAFARQEIPFERIVGELQVPRDLSRSPVFQVVFVMQTAPKSVELTTDVMLTASGGTLFDLSLTAVEVKDGVYINAEYNTDLFDAATMARFLEQYETLLAAVARRIDQPLSSIRIISATAANQLNTFAFGRASTLPAPTVAALVDAQAAASPESVAVVGNGVSWTYAALERRSNQVAQRLRALGVEAGQRVGVCVDRTPEMVAALWGVWKAGAAYVPMDPSFPPERLAFMAQDAELTAILTDTGSAAAVPPTDATVLVVDDSAAWADVTDAPLAPTATAADVAYVIYTSGSTGRPKGVAVPHRAVVNFLASMAATPGLTAADALLAVTTLSFDIAGLELWLPLTVGARVELASREEAGDGRLLQARLQQSGATVLQATPATWRMLLEAGWQPGPALRMFCGGEGLPRELADRLLAGGGTLWNLYGPTETTIWSTAEQVMLGGAVIAIGQPIANTQVYVLDAIGQRVPIGVLGELYIGGAGVALGYHRRPELTAEKFVPDSLSGVAGARMYRTGDVARWLPDGRLQCLGRIDHQVKVRGFRVELGEIETALAAQPGIHQAVVTVHPDASGEHRLVAYVVPHDGIKITATELRRALKMALPEYMVPSLFIELDALPLTDNRKVNRRALPPPFAAVPASERFIEPATPTARQIAAIWCEVLGIDRVSADANFFDVGGHSLLAMKVIARIESSLGVRFGARALMLETLEQMAASCERQLGAATGAAMPARVRRAAYAGA